MCCCLAFLWHVGYAIMTLMCLSENQIDMEFCLNAATMPNPQLDGKNEKTRAQVRDV